MGGCKARKCIENKDKEMKKDSDGKEIDGSQWNDFKRCNKKVYKDGFCKISFLIVSICCLIIFFPIMIKSKYSSSLFK